jgi:hypothetical protein
VASITAKVGNCRQYHSVASAIERGRTGKPQTGASTLMSRPGMRHDTLAMGGDFQALGQPVTITAEMLLDLGETWTLMPYRPVSGAFPIAGVDHLWISYGYESQG